MSKLLVINLFGAPGAGKSTLAAYVFSKLKMAGINAELVTEFAKDKTWEENHTALANQVFMLGNQYHRVFEAQDKVECIITDSPLFLSALYNKDPVLGEDFNRLTLRIFNQYNNLNFFVLRAKPYNPIGRNQTEEESNALSEELKKLLERYGIKYTTLKGTLSNAEAIVEEALYLLRGE